MQITHVRGGNPERISRLGGKFMFSTPQLPPFSRWKPRGKHLLCVCVANIPETFYLRPLISAFGGKLEEKVGWRKRARVKVGFISCRSWVRPRVSAVPLAEEGHLKVNRRSMSVSPDGTQSVVETGFLVDRRMTWFFEGRLGLGLRNMEKWK